MFLRNGDYYDYPFRQAIKSALGVADEVVVCECYSDKDNTFEELQKLAAADGRIKIVRHNWVTDFRQLSALGNYAATFLNTKWQWQLQADEVLHEDTYAEIRKLTEEHVNTPNVTAIRVKYFHFLANYETEFDFCYRELVRIAKPNTGWQLVGDAAQLDGGNQGTVVNSDIHVYHYGKVHSGAIGYQKEVDFQQLYTDIGFPDPKMKIMKDTLGEGVCDYIYLFEEAIKRGEVRKFVGTHPALMSDRIKLFQDNGWEQWESLIQQGLKIAHE